MKLSSWVKHVGGYGIAAKILKVHETTVIGWVHGKSTPKPLMMRKIVQSSWGEVTFDEIIAETKKVKPLRIGG